MLVWRRAGSARSLLLAATLAALIATALLAGLAGYNQSVIVAGARSAVASAPASERSVLVQGPGKPSADAVLRQSLPGWSVSAAGYASGRQFGGPTGAASKDANGVVYASVVYLEGIKDHARLVEGAWPTPGAGQTAIGVAAARILGLKTGSPVPIVDRRTLATSTLTVSGVFEANDLDDAFWLLAPEMAYGTTPGGSTYGPLVLERSDFDVGGWDDKGRSGWLAEPNLTSIELADLIALREQARTLVPTLPEAMGMGSGGQVATSIESLVGRLQRADLVGRSALLTPLLLIVVLGGYALLLLAGLLTEQRRPETALLRARGAGRWQLAWLAAQEGLLVALPAVIIVALFTAGTWRSPRAAAACWPWCCPPCGATPPIWRIWRHDPARARSPPSSGPASTSPWSPSPCWPGFSCANIPHRWPGWAGVSASIPCSPPRHRSVCWPPRWSPSACFHR